MIFSKNNVTKLIFRSLFSSIVSFSIYVNIVSSEMIKGQYRQFDLLVAKIEEYKQNIMLIGIIAEKSIENDLLVNRGDKIKPKNTDYKFGIYSVNNDDLTKDEIVILNMSIKTFGYLPSFLYGDKYILYYRSYTGRKYITSKKIDGFTLHESMFNQGRCNIVQTCTIFAKSGSLEDRIIISPIYKDKITNKNIITLSSPVFKKGKVIGDFNIDMYLEEYNFLKDKTISFETENIYEKILIEDDKYPFHDLTFVREHHLDNRTSMKYKIPFSKVIVDNIWSFLLMLVGFTMITWKLMVLTEKKAMLVKAKCLINRDYLTGLYNRSIFKDENFIRIKETSNIAIIAIDGNKLKKINDTYGHYVGDEAIKQIAYGMKLTFRDNDYLVRNGGDEFLALLPNCSLEVAEKLSIELKNNISRDRFSMHSINIDVSVGLAISLIDEDLEYSINKADSMLYSEKKKIEL